MLKLLLGICFLPFLGINGSKFPYLNFLIMFIQIIFAPLGYILLLNTLRNRNNKQYNGIFVFLVGLYIILIIVSSFINNNLSLGVIYTNISLFGIYLYYYYYCMHNLGLVLDAISKILIIYILINILIVILNVSWGFYYVNESKIFVGLFTNRNTIPLILVPAIFIFTLNSLIQNKKIDFRCFLSSSLSYFLIYISKSSTGLIVATISIIFIFLISKGLLKVSKWKLSILYVFIYLAIVIFRIQNFLLKEFIEETLNKRITFTGRTELWDTVIRNISLSPIIGFGSKNEVLSNSYGIKESHNGIIEILLWSGILGLVVFLLIIIFSLRNCKVDINSQILISAIFCYFIGNLTESGFTLNRYGFWLFIIFVISYKSREKKII